MVNITKTWTIPDEQFYDHMKKFIRTKGIWESVDKNVRDIMVLRPNGSIELGNYVYETLMDMKELLEGQTRRGAKLPKYLRARNAVSGKTILEMLQALIK